MKTQNILSLLFVAIIVISCNNNTIEIPDDQTTDLIEITKSQFEIENMKLGDPELRPFPQLVHFTGLIKPSTKGLANISLAIPGLINNINCNSGELVKKGQVLFEISGNDFVDIQKDFAESSAILARLKSEYERTKELFDDNIGTQKDLIFSESSYKSEMAKYTALKIKLEQIGLDISKIENGSFYASYSLRSPINGYVSSIYTSLGQHVEPNYIIAEIINDQLFQLKLSIFEKDINELEIGQNIEFYLRGNRQTLYKAKLNFTGKTINSNTKVIDCYAEIENLENLNLVNNQFVEGDVIVGNDSAYSLPKTAILKSENQSYILKLENESDMSYFFSKIKVKTGITNKEFIELVSPPQVNHLLLKGTYNIQID
jgi:cobalt-zinc-cadmium efflux system membrane fusion protein